MLYWLIYDISENKIRTKIVSICKNYGMFRIQKSSFMGGLSKNKMEMLAIDIKNLELGENDCVFIIPSCKSCFSEKEILGHLEEEKIKERNFYIIGR